MEAGKLRDIALTLIVMLLSLSIHEFAHAWTADRLGDDTPRRQGRLTLSPLAHLDVFGTILVPLIAAYLVGFALIGWAKPVQFVPSNLTRKISMRTGTALIAAAGPVSNLIFAIIALALLRVLGGDAPERSMLGALDRLLIALFLTNVGLFVFNLLPLPPLDGSRLLPRSLDRVQELVAPYSILLLLVVLNVPVLSRVLIYAPVGFVIRALQSLFGIEVVGWGA